MILCDALPLDTIILCESLPAALVEHGKFDDFISDTSEALEKFDGSLGHSW